MIKYFCDICKKEVPEEEYYILELRSSLLTVGDYGSHGSIEGHHACVEPIIHDFQDKCVEE